MECPYCRHPKVRTKDTRSADGEVRRRRECLSCGEQFETVERISAHDVVVVKRGGDRNEKFSRTKLRRGIEKAATKDGVDAASVDAIVERVVRRLRPRPGEPVSSSHLGSLVLRVLAGDRPELAVTRIRYAIVFLGRTTRTGGFRSVRDFLSWLEGEYKLGSSAAVAAPSVVVDRRGQRSGFDISKLERGIGIASKGRGTDEEVSRLATRVAARVQRELHGQAIVTTQQVAAEVLKALKDTDHLAYLRYASAVKQYRSADDFWLDAVAIVDDKGGRPS